MKYYCSDPTLRQLYKKHGSDAGLDICSAMDLFIEARDDSVISTSLHVAIPEGFVGLVWSRSGLSVSHDIEVGAGCIDSGYTGEILVHLYNLGDHRFRVYKGDRIAQLLTVPCNAQRYTRVKSLDEFTKSERQGQGFGSTGI